MHLTTDQIGVILIVFAIADVLTFALRVWRETYLKKKLKECEARQNDLGEKCENLSNELWGLKEGYKQLMKEVANLRGNTEMNLISQNQNIARIERKLCTNTVSDKISVTVSEENNVEVKPTPPGPWDYRK